MRKIAFATLAVAALAVPPVAKAQDVRQGLAASSAIEEIKKRGTLRVGLSTFVPWAFRSKSGDLIGYEVDVAKKLAEDMGVKPEFVPTAWDGIIPALLAGQFDFIIGGMTITPARNLTVNFTSPYSATGVDVVASKKLAGGFKTLADFDKPTVTLAARRGTSAATTAQRMFPKATLRLFDDDAPALLEVQNDRAHAWVSTVPKPGFAALDHPDTLFRPFPDVLVKQADAMAVRKGDPDALNFLNNWIQSKTLDGWLAERQAYWFKAREWKDQQAQ
ncbi:MAG: transporter substrate-binding domain-containing protein [Alphaproteobacteria bacterium]|nr:transporter substrate-binding domain-containing protein [Alphaproteobacteria bacterium]